ncbi:MAG: hypothetical protein CVU91_13450 [Firmicutes bacterium HGW-Firmicutes-16]|nr:MAG: hypothetical protein CVU91_13450 [Firmicutes bacterium HGW-Firmicutes-16]
MTIDQAYSELLLRIQNIETLYEQLDSHVLHSFSLFWTIVVGVFAIIGVALYFIAQRMAEKGIKKYSNDSQLKINDYEKRITTLEINLREMSTQMLSEINKRARIVTGSYVGTGTFGSGCENVLCYFFEPKALIISTNHPGSTSGVFFNPNVYGINIESDNNANPSIIRSMCLTWKGNEVRWYSTRSALYQLNEERIEYHYTIIG